MSDEWGPWIEHDGMGCPCIGMWVETVSESRGGKIMTASGRANNGPSWYRGEWGTIHYSQGRPIIVACIIRYRIRKPRGLIILENIVATLDAPEGPIRAPVQPKVNA